MCDIFWETRDLNSILKKETTSNMISLDSGCFQLFYYKNINVIFNFIFSLFLIFVN